MWETLHLQLFQLEFSRKLAKPSMPTPTKSPSGVTVFVSIIPPFYVLYNSCHVLYPLLNLFLVTTTALLLLCYAPSRVLIFSTNIISASYVTQISYYIRFLQSRMCYLFILFDASSVEHRE